MQIKNTDYVWMQVYLQLPTGQTVPVHIPATISTVLPMASPEQQQQSQQQTAAVPTQPQPTKLAVRQPVTTSPPATNNSTMALKQVQCWFCDEQGVASGHVSSSHQQLHNGIKTGTVLVL